MRRYCGCWATGSNATRSSCLRLRSCLTIGTWSCGPPRTKERDACCAGLGVPENMSVEPQTLRQIGGLRDRKPKHAEHRFATVRRRPCTAARPGGLIARQRAACGGLKQRRVKLRSWARPPYAGRGLSRGGAAKRGLPRATVRWPRWGTTRAPAGCGVPRCGGTRPAIRSGSPAEQLSQLRERESHLFVHLPRLHGSFPRPSAQPAGTRTEMTQWQLVVTADGAAPQGATDNSPRASWGAKTTNAALGRRVRYGDGRAKRLPAQRRSIEAASRRGLHCCHAASSRAVSCQDPDCIAHNRCMV